MNSSTKKTIVAPSILSADPGKYAIEIAEMAKCGADWIHIDVMDGSFVPPITFGANIVATARKACALFLDVHLMVVNPEKHFTSFKEAGSDRIIFHHEASPNPAEALRSISKLGIKNGICIKPATSIESILPYLELCDLVLIMTVNPGWGGQTFMPAGLAKIAPLKKEIDKRKLNTVIEVDGGINAETGLQCVKAGATALVAGNYIFASSDRAAAIENLQKLRS